MDEKSTRYLSLFFIAILVSIFSGCTSLSGQSNQDDLFVTYFLDYTNEKPTFFSNDPNQQMLELGTYWKTLSITYYDKIAPLDVSSDFELPKNYFLEYLNQNQISADYLLQGPSMESIRTSNPSKYQQYMADMNQANQITMTYLIKAITEPNMCKALRERVPEKFSSEDCKI